MNINKDLLATCWTWAGNAAPLRGDEKSPLNIHRRVRAVSDAGWRGIGLIHADLPIIQAELGFDNFRQKLLDEGIEHVELEFLANWWKTGDLRKASDLQRGYLLESANALGAQTIKIGGELSFDDEPASVDEEAFANEFDALATQAGNAGVRVALEPMPMNNVRTIPRGAEFVRQIGNPHGGLTIDTWHVARSGTNYADLPKILPMDFVFVVEIDDARSDVVGTLWEDTINTRLNPGEGDLDPVNFVVSMYQAGWRGHWGVEIISEEQRTKA